MAALLTELKIPKATIFGFSNGGTTAMQVAIRHPRLVHKLVLAAATFKRAGLMDGFFDMIDHATLSNMPPELKTSFLEVNPDSARLQVMFDRDKNRMIHFKDMPLTEIESISAPALVINGDRDVVKPEHAVEIYRLIKNSQLLIVPGEHGDYLGEITTLKNGTKDYSLLVRYIREFVMSENLKTN